MHQPHPRIFKPHLKRNIGLFEATLYGIGIILGAGIYALIGDAAAIAGNALWLSFILSTFIAALTALSYAELSGMFPREAAEYVYMQASFKRNSLAFLISWIALFSGVLSVATVSLAFAGYFIQFFPLSPLVAALGLILVLSIINFIGMKESARFNTIFTLVEAGGLVIIIAIGLQYFGAVNYFETPVAAANLFQFLQPVAAATALIFFAYIGFEDLANITEETRNPKRTIPIAMLLSLAISTVLYILVAIAAVSAVEWQQLAKSDVALALVAQKGFGPSGYNLLSGIALFSTANTALIILIAVSRRIYGMSEEKCLPGFLRKIHSRTGTPFIAVFLTMVAAMLFTLVGNVTALAFLTILGVFVIFFAVNCCVIALRYAKPNAKRTFKTPLSIGKFPILPFFGAITCLAMLLQFPPVLMGFALIAFAISLPIYYILNKLKLNK